MKICLIGKNLSNLLLAKVLANKNLNIDIIYNYEDNLGIENKSVTKIGF